MKKILIGLILGLIITSSSNVIAEEFNDYYLEQSDKSWDKATSAYDISADWGIFRMSQSNGHILRGIYEEEKKQTELLQQLVNKGK